MFGLLVACSVSFACGAAAGLFVSPPYLQALLGERPSPVPSGRVARFPSGRLQHPGPWGTWQFRAGRASRLADRLLGREIQKPRSPRVVVDRGPSAAERIATNVVVLNGTDRQGLASEAAEMLRAAGWTVWDVGDASRLTYQKSEVLMLKGKPGLAIAIGSALELSPSVLPASEAPPEPGVDASHVDDIVILGQDFLEALRALGTTDPIAPEVN